jgi:hypothetical protein
VIVALLVILAGIQVQNPASYLSELVSRMGEGTASPAAVRNLSDVERLQVLFNADKGHLRLILLLSPT